jgi:hypothetical protein
MLERKKSDEELIKLSRAVAAATALVRKLARIPSEETEPEMSRRLGLWEAGKQSSRRPKPMNPPRWG